MENINFAYMIGAERSGIRWGRPMIFFTALFLAGIASTMSFQLYMTLFAAKENVSYPLLPSAFTLLDNIFSNLILSFVLLLFFYLIRNQLLALLAAAILFLPFDIAINYLQRRFSLPKEMLGTFEFPWLSSMFISLMFVIWVVGGIVLAVYLIKQTWLAILIGAIVGRLIFRLSLDAYFYLTDDIFEFTPSTLILVFGSSTIFAALLWFGLRMTAEKTAFAEVEKPRLSKEFYVGTWASTTAVAIITAIIVILGIATGSSGWDKSNLSTAFLVLAAVSFLATYGAVVFSVLIYKMWAAINDGHARTTPGKALGYLFIPFYNIYWMFQALPGFAEDYNAYVDRHQSGVAHISKALFTAYCAAIICTVLPLIGFVANIVAIFVGIAMMAKICDAVNALPARQKLGR